MILIVEGLDGCGKTTICEEIAERYGFKYIKESYTDNCEEKENRMINMLTRLTEGPKNYIYDRTTLIDDFVYGFLNERPSTLTKYFDTIITLLSKCKIVHLEIDENIRKERLEKRGDDYITNEDTTKIQTGYDAFYYHLNNVEHVRLSGNLKEDIKNIMEVIDYD